MITRRWIRGLLFGLCLLAAPLSARAADVTISNVSVSENGAMTFTATLNNGPVAGGFSVDIVFADGSATGGGTDYDSTVQTLVFAGNPSESKQFTVGLNQDAIVEANESFTVSMANLVPAVAVNISDTATGTIRDDDVPTLSVGDVSFAEGDGGTTIANFTVSSSLSVAANASITFYYNIWTGWPFLDAENGDFSGSNWGTVSISGGSSTTIPISITADTVVEADETFIMYVYGADIPGSSVNPQYQSQAPYWGTTYTYGTGTIRNDDVPTLSIDSLSTGEGNSGSTSLWFTVSSDLTVAGDASVNFDWSVSGAGANPTEAGDLTGTLSGSSTIQGGNQRQLQVKVAGDTIVEGDETFEVTLSGLSITDSGGVPTTGAPYPGVGTITNDDIANLSIDDVTVSESAGNAVFTITSDKTVENPATVTVGYGATDGTASAGADFTGTSGTASISGTSATVTVPILNDSVVERDETFFVDLAGPGGSVPPVLADTRGDGKITNDDIPDLTIGDVSDSEGTGPDKTVNFSVVSSLQIDSDVSVTVNYAVSHVSTDGGDFSGSTSGTLTLSNLAAWGGVNLPVTFVADAVVEKDETFTVGISGGAVQDSGSVATFSDPSGDGTITNDDSPSLSIDDVTLQEGDGGSTVFTFTVSSNLSVAGNQNLNFDFTASPSGVEPCEAGDLSGSLSGNATISNGTSTQVSIDVVGDVVVETDETFQVVLSNNALPDSTVGSTISDGVGVGTITNDDTFNVNIEAGSKSALEDEGPITFEVTLSNPVEWDISVAYGFNSGSSDTATLNVDYADAGAGPLVFSGATSDVSKTITVNMIDDAVQELPDEFFTVTLSNPSPATSGSLGTSMGTGVIRNDDHKITMSSGPEGEIRTVYGGGHVVVGGSLVIDVAHDDTPTFTMTNTDAENCYHIDDVQVDGSSVGAVPTYTFSPVVTDHSINVDFAINEYTLTATQYGNHGTLTAGKTVDCNTSSHTFTATAESGFHISWFKVDGVPQALPDNTLHSVTFDNVKANHTIEAAFTQVIEVIDASPFGKFTPAGDGESGLLEVNYGATQVFTAEVHVPPMPPGLAHGSGMHNITDHHLSDLVVDGVSVPGVKGSGLSTYDYTFTNIIADHTIEVLFTSLIDVSVTGPGKVTGTVLFDNSGSTGTITGTDEVEAGVDHMFTMEPDIGYHVGSIVVGDYDPYNGSFTSAGVGQPEIYTFPEVLDMDHAFEVNFVIDTFTLEPVSTFGTIYDSAAQTVEAGIVQVDWSSDHSFYVDLDDPDHAVMGILVDNTSYPLPTSGSSVTYPAFTLINSMDDYLEVRFTAVRTSHRLEVQDYDKTPISDVPLDARLRPKPASLMFVLDDSGSMDWEVITTESSGLFSNRYYLYSYPSSARAYSDNSLQRYGQHDEIKAQWTGYNKMFYNPAVVYAPWPTFDGTNPTSYLPSTAPFADGEAHANIYRPRYHPWRSVDCINALLKADGTDPNADLSGCNDDQTFNMDGSFLNFIVYDNANEHIVDNLDAGYSETGVWRTSTSNQSYGADYRYAYGIGGGTKTATWTVVPTVSGEHQIDIWHVRNNKRETITYTVRCVNCGPGGTDVKLSQRQGGGDWSTTLGNFELVAGETVTVTLTDDHQKRNSSCADAIRILPVGVNMDIVNAHYITFNDTDGDGEFRYNDSNGDGQLDAGETILDTLYLVNLRNPVEYYQIVDNNGVIDGANLVKVPAASLPPTVLTYADPMDPDAWLKERQNWADWFSYYRKRTYSATAAVAQVIDRMSEVEVGFRTINYSGNGYEHGGYGFSQAVLPVEVAGEVDRTNRLLEILYGFQVAGYGTPLRNGLKSVGQYYDDKDTSYGGVCAGYTGGGSCIPAESPFHDQLDGDECKQVFAVVMTDGFWNGGNPSVGNVDGNDGAPYADSVSNTLADVAMKYFENDLSTMPDQVPDSVTWQHMVTYSVSFGVHGTLNPADYNFNTGNYPSWPTPSADSERTIDDLWHAAVNGRGKWYSADRPDQLVNSLLSIMKDIGTRIGTGASVSVNGDELYEEVGENIRMYQTSYNSGSWYGDLKSFRLDVNKNEVLIGDPVWSALEKLDNLLSASGHAGRVIASYNGSSGVPFHWLDGTGQLNFSALQQKQMHPYFSQTLTGEDLVDFLRGDKTNAGGEFRNRTKPLGDFVNSLAKYEDGFLYVGSNDGMLHAFWAIDTEDKDRDGSLDAGIEDLDGDGHFDDVYEDLNGDCILGTEDVDGDGRLDVNEDVDGDGNLDVAEDLDGDGHLDVVNEDLDGDGELDPGEDLDGDGHLDTVNEDVDGDGTLDPYNEDLDGDGLLDVDEDANANGILDSEDLDGDGHLDVGEDRNCNNMLDPTEDVDGDGFLDRTEDLDGDHNFDVENEDLDHSGTISQGGEERFAYVPGLVFHNLRELANPQYDHKFYVDNTPYIEKISDNLTLLVGGLGKGGKGYYSLDITDAATITSEAELMSRVKWEYPPPPATLLTSNTFSFESGTGAGGNDVIRDSANGFVGADFAPGKSITIAGAYFNNGVDYGSNDRTYTIESVDPAGGFIEMEPGSLISGYGNTKDILVTRSISDPDMGYSFSKPIIIKSNDRGIGSGELQSYVVLFGNGYESENGRAVLYVLDPENGSVIRKIDTGTGPFNGLSSVSATDINNDLRVDYVYAGDLLGNMWKFDLTSNDSANWQVAYCDGADSVQHCKDAGSVAGIVAKPLFSGKARQPITSAPDIMFKRGGPGYIVVFGTGKYLGTPDVESIDVQSVYGIWDWAHDSIDDGYLGARVDNTVPDPDVAQLSNWPQTEVDGSRTHTLLRQDFLHEGIVYLEPSGNLVVDDGGGVNVKVGYYRVPTDNKGDWDAELRAVSFDANKDGSVDANDKYRYPVAHLGWYFDLPGILDVDGDTQDNDRDGLVDEDDDADGKIDERKLGERVINDAIIRDNKVIVISFGVTGTRCNAGAYSFVNERYADNGGMPLQPALDVNGDGEVDDRDRLKLDDANLVNLADKAFEGRLHNPTILRENEGNDDNPEETRFFSSSDGSIQTTTGPRETAGIYFWQQTE